MTRKRFLDAFLSSSKQERDRAADVITEAARIMELGRAGKSVSEIVKLTGLPRSIVLAHVKKGN